ncbi:MAG: amino acid racemase [Candidatus Aminicenantes bacterium]|nr:MAG: amino acid racemase [Candidatus Aminicenantes bacterium]
MSKRIGILGGMSHESTVVYYDFVHKKYYERYKNYNYPEIVVFSLNFQKVINYEHNGDSEGYTGYLLEGIHALVNAGADFVIMSANSPHAFFRELEKQSTVPMISIAEETIKKAKKERMKRLLLTGIKFTMKSHFYKEVGNKYGIEIVTPSGKEQDRIDSIIFDELCLGVFNESSKKRVVSIIESYPVDGVILGCTELPLLIEQDDTEMPLLNTSEIHAEAALAYALS